MFWNFVSRKTILISYLLFVFLFLLSPQVFAQGLAQDFGESEFGGDPYGDMQDPTSPGFADPGGFGDPLQPSDGFGNDPLAQPADGFGGTPMGGDSTGTGGYVDEQTFTNAASQMQMGLMSQRTLVVKERMDMNANLAYGGGTGLMIGAWIAMLRPSTTRDNFRTIGSSLVLGATVGVLLGTRTLWDPYSQRPVDPMMVPPDLMQGPAGLPPGVHLFQKKKGAAFAYNWKF